MAGKSYPIIALVQNADVAPHRTWLDWVLPHLYSLNRSLEARSYYARMQYTSCHVDEMNYIYIDMSIITVINHDFF